MREESGGEDIYTTIDPGTRVLKMAHDLIGTFLRSGGRRETKIRVFFSSFLYLDL